MKRNLLIGALLVLALAAISLRAPQQVIGYFPDTYVSIWSIWHPAHEPIFSTQLAFAPLGSSLVLHNLAELITLPFSLLSGHFSLSLIYNLLVFSCLYLNFVAGLLLVGRVTKSSNISLIGALVLGLHPFILGHVGGGHINLFAVFPTYLLIYFALAPQVSSLCVAIALLMVVLTDYYQFWVALIALSLLWSFNRSRSLLLGTCAGIGLAMLKIAPALALISSGTYTPNHDPSLHSLPALALLTRHTTQVLSAANPFSLNWAETGGYLGFVGAVLMALCVFRPESRRFAITAAVFTVLSLGPTSYLYSLINLTHAAPPVPARFFLGTLIFGTLAGAAFVATIKSRGPKVLIALALICDLCPKPLPTLTLKTPTIITFPQPAKTTERLPFFDISGPELAMYNQTQHGMPIVNGFLARRPKAAERRVRQLSRYIDDFCAAPSAAALTKLHVSMAQSGVGGLVLVNQCESANSCEEFLVSHTGEGF